MSGIVAGSRIRMQSDIWKFPVNGPPAENTRRGLRITHQTGQAQTPSVSPDESEVVYLSDSGGHGNLWIARTDGSGVRQITFERNPAISVGVPVWSPAGNQIVFILTRPGMTGLSLINRDGSGLRQLVPVGYSAAWSADGRWVYYSRDTDDTICIEKTAIEGGPAISVRCDNANASAPTADGSALYFVKLPHQDQRHRGPRNRQGPSRERSVGRAGPRGRVAGTGQPEVPHSGPVAGRQVADHAPVGWRNQQHLGAADQWRGRCGRSPTSAIAPS